jgi:hypothetical protein
MILGIDTEAVSQLSVTGHITFSTLRMTFVLTSDKVHAFMTKVWQEDHAHRAHPQDRSEPYWISFVAVTR